MHQRLTLFVMLAGLLLSACAPTTPDGQAAAGSPAPADDDWQIEPLADGVWAALQPAERRFDDSNSLIVAGDGVALVVDSQSTLERTRALIAQTRRLTPHPVRWLVNTHWHADHTNGNSAWREAFPELTIVGQDTTREDIETRAMPDHLERIGRWDAAIEAADERLELGVDREGDALDATGRATLAGEIDDARRHVDAMRAIRAEPPELTVSNAMTIHLGGRTVELHAFRAHTRGDVVVLVPDVAVLASGDLLDDLPYGGHGYPTSWLAALDRIDALAFEMILPGHGPVFRGRDQLSTVRDLLRTALDGAAIDDPPMLALRERFVGDDPVAARNWDVFVPALIERVAAERAGELD